MICKITIFFGKFFSTDNKFVKFEFSDSAAMQQFATYNNQCKKNFTV